MRAVTENIARRNGTHSTTCHSNPREKAAPAIVAVTTAEGSRFAAPVTIPGANCLAVCQPVHDCRGGRTGKFTTAAYVCSLGFDSLRFRCVTGATFCLPHRLSIE